MKYGLVTLFFAVGCVSEVPSMTDGSTTMDGTTGDAAGGDDGQANDSGLMGCPGRVPDDAKGVFVAQNGTDMNACGTRMSPCKTIQFGIAQATQTTKSTIYVAANNVPYVETVTMSPGITIEGGWSAGGSTWTPICDSSQSSAVTIQGATNKTILASYNGSASLRFVTITSKMAATAESLYGVFATGAMTEIVLDQIAIKMTDGGGGVVGSDGVMGGGGMGTCSAGDGANGSDGTVGTGGVAGTFSAAGYVPSTGGDGTASGDAHNGTVGGNGTCNNSCFGCKSGINTCALSNPQMICGAIGQSGCGGKAGGFGTGGSGGGATIAVFTFDAKVTIFSGSFASGNGGKGGDGGKGAMGGGGSAGVGGMSASCNTAWGCTNNTCVNPTVTMLSGGTKGGTGGAGGTGGGGGGGGGGPSFAIVSGMAAKVMLSKTPMLVHGSGGMGGGVGGATGQANDMFAF